MAVAGNAALARFTEWLTRFGDAWEAADAARVGELFVVGATFQPTPFDELLRGRRQIAGWFGNQFATWSSASFSAQVLGAGATYGVAHWRVEKAGRALDGVMVAALDPRGRCTSLRQWWHTTPGPVA